MIVIDSRCTEWNWKNNPCFQEMMRKCVMGFLPYLGHGYMFVIFINYIVISYSPKAKVCYIVHISKCVCRFLTCRLYIQNLCQLTVGYSYELNRIEVAWLFLQDRVLEIKWSMYTGSTCNLCVLIAHWTMIRLLQRLIIYIYPIIS
jgi:hypothetical protein